MSNLINCGLRYAVSKFSYNAREIISVSISNFYSDLKEVKCSLGAGGGDSKKGKLLKDKFEKCKTIVGTQQLHSFEPAEDNKVKVKKYNASENSRVVKIYH